MKAKVGDMVRITHTDYSGVEGYGVGDIQYIAEVGADEDAFLGDDQYYFSCHEFELINQTDTISAQIKARMEQHMTNGEYVRAVKWAAVLEAVEELEELEDE